MTSSDSAPRAPAAGDGRAPWPRQAAAAPGRPLARRAHGVRRGARAAGVPRQAALAPTTSTGWSTTRPQMTDLPAAQRDEIVVGVPADADDADPHARGRPRHDPQDAVAAVRRRAGRVGADALPRPGHDVRLVAGRLRHGLPVLRHRPGRAPAQHVHRRDRRAGRRRSAVAGAGRGARWAGARLQRRVHGHGRAAGQLQGRHRRRTPSHRARARRARDERARCDRVDGRAGAADQPARRARASRSRWRCRCTRRTTSCATSWSRSTPATRSTRRSTRRGTTRASPSVGSRSSTP